MRLACVALCVVRSFAAERQELITCRWLRSLAALIERAQFAHNPKMYTKEGFAAVLHRDGFSGSWLDWLLRETETSHGALPTRLRSVQGLSG